VHERPAKAVLDVEVGAEVVERFKTLGLSVGDRQVQCAAMPALRVKTLAFAHTPAERRAYGI
jgi:hypothetical protein